MRIKSIQIIATNFTHILSHIHGLEAICDFVILVFIFSDVNYYNRVINYLFD